MAIFAMSLDLLVGYTGLVSFGHAAYFGLAGYALALMAPKYETVSLWWTLPASIGVCALFALVTGMLVLRTRGIYFIMVTLAFAQMLFFIFHDTKLGGGSDGVYIYAKPTMQWGETVLLNLEKLENFYWLVLVLAAGSYLLLRRILGSSFGRALLGIKVNEHRMRALGFPVFKYQLASFTLAGALGGLAGYMAAVQYGFVNPEILSWHQSGAVLMMVILGGMGTLYGLGGRRLRLRPAAGSAVQPGLVRHRRQALATGDGHFHHAGRALHAAGPRRPGAEIPQAAAGERR
jgi:branched-chain amino acid transport system permease protein